MPNHKSTLQLSGLIVAALFLIQGGMKSYANSPEFYASSSALAQGNWAKVEVSETGIQFISDATLRGLGFTDPEKVNIFGYGGEVIPETLDSPDDLPLVPSMRVNGGIVFFGKGSVRWAQSYSDTKYTHQSHPYSDIAYYFISDSMDTRPGLENYGNYNSGGIVIDKFTERLVHEEDLSMPMTSGRLMLGEDFRTTTARTFQFKLIDNVGSAKVLTAFGCKPGVGTATLTFSANGEALTATANDRISPSDAKLILTTKSLKEVKNPGTNLDYTIKFNGNGATIAGLDYIEVEYTRALNLYNGELYFYISPDVTSEVKISGCSGSTVVWDVTDPLAPREVTTKLEGSTLSFNASNGYQEFVAFEPSKISRAVTNGIKVENQDLHSMEAPDMLVISPQEYLPAAQRLVTLHELTDGLSVAVLTPEVIYNEFSSGKPDLSAFRKLLKMWYDRAQGKEGEYTSYCLIMSRPTYDNKMVTTQVKSAGYPRIPIWQSPTGDTETTSYSTDDYIGMLEDVYDVFNIGNARINVAVGRMPVKSLAEANQAIDKLEEYINSEDYGTWRNQVMIIADDQDNGIHLSQAETALTAMQSEGKGRNYLYEKLYLDAYPLEYTGTGAAYPQAHERLMSKWNEGLAYINYIGHANPKNWGHEYLLTWTDINAMTNRRLPFIYAATCEFMRWDADEISGAEVLWLMPSAGVIGMICPSREVLISANGTLNKSTSTYLFYEDENGETLTVGEMMVRGKNDSNTGTNKLRYGIIGDPSMKIPWPKLNVKIDEINGIDPENCEDLPVISARSTVKLKGHVEDRDGNLLEDFNGIAEISLYDAEKVITTNGNGKDGVQSVYNDRKTRLFVGRVKVNEGKWSTEFTMPSEIENNYSPALISLYAYEEKGREANGACENLYVYGYDQNVPDDFDGPKIIEFYLNSPGFVSGNQVSPNPTLKVKVYDESGISVSEAGIGHNITLSLDGKKFYDDVAQYYLPDENDSGAGSLTYLLTDVEQGNHTLSFTVWDNANNSTTATLDFSISALWKPSIETLTTDVNPATSGVNFIVATDGSTSSMECSIDVYDIWGRHVWYNKAPNITSGNSRTTMSWNLCDFGGARIPGGVYLYRATVKTESGATVSKTRKLMVAAQ
ncbi:MAG: type IX secretion system sortase PorU [Muribaculaceae bacterium]|nr:type IX secretion system sortase PorU [Muribaculaceae bacterium]